ncbi:glutamate [NMDA] receptor subunit 1-like isoform X1 [Scylla paramamosain]|uniref:glutamate [NMDA] receptor subunit 1-like isoform X1 n=2 Tax=Scylla paramamosain TaxID=85552 RepID=UPI003083E94F
MGGATRCLVVCALAGLGQVVGAATLRASFSTMVAGRVESRASEVSEAQVLLTEVVSREMSRCALVLLYDTPDALPLLVPALLLIPYGVSLVYLASLDAATAFTLKNRVDISDASVCRGVVVAARDGSWRRLLQEASHLWVGHTFTFLLLLSDEDLTHDVPSLLLHPTFRFGAQVVAAARQDNDSWHLHTTSLFTNHHRHHTTPLDTWRPRQGFRRGVRLFPKDKMNNMQGFTFTVAALPYDPFITPANVALTGPGKYRGLEVRLLDVLAEAANFTYRYVAPKDGQWGRLKKDGTWTGMIGMVAEEKADWAMSDITFSPEREQYVDFSRTFVYDASELVTPRAKPLPRWTSPTRPFKWEVWVAVVIVVAAAGPFLCVLARICTDTYLSRVTWFHHLGNSILFIVQPVLQRGGDRDIVIAPGRMFFGFWLVFAMIVGISYSSSLTSFLIMPGLQKPIENLHQLVTSDIGWAKVYFGGVQSALLDQAQDPDLIALREGVQWRDSLPGILQEVVAGKLATWDNGITTRLLVASKFTDTAGQPLVHFPGFHLLQERIAWPLQQHAPYKRRLDQLIDQVVGAGLMEKWLEFIIFEEQALSRRERERADTAIEAVEGTTGGTVILSLEHFQGPFFVLLLGCLCGGVALLLEVFVKVLYRTEIK